VRTVIAFDRDPDAIANGAEMVEASGRRLKLIHAQFSELLDHVEEASLDGVVLDIGVSSMQIDEAERGFSFMRDGPLDMRMGQSGVSAADVVNRAKASDLTRIFGILGEERHAGRIARAIEAERQKQPFSDHAATGRTDRKGLAAAAAGQDPSGNPGVPGAADLCQ
jgi:16S rRNA (cytosine1402-N4)-methyltransferase